jgi:hypothetical protein
MDTIIAYVLACLLPQLLLFAGITIGLIVLAVITDRSSRA